ncbi:hypothetical protein P3T36_004480 [Kitasatospora sp. MAP12-15]|uniref:hypothetical protein n=1 Tax=unclassified Kitasatospora TaxID=2633591 RepID=UPI0024752688|nr:hypothetical protein [Kitasatospora sp. MAP12-44]MDH6110907.1 hypothetical protein [Kitasatospora sp. MAP12-44]
MSGDDGWEPNQPGDAETRALSVEQLRGLLDQLHAVGKPLGVIFPSADCGGRTIDGGRLVSFGGGPASTVVNLLHLLREHVRRADE